ncbi:hypothetical protein IQ255_23575 [Pleurocapsales cyanobacterium LEGE 10410]|nr:hypothetical protein [Pleurocapsales cyanobacterium LEGE 10410]
MSIYRAIFKLIQPIAKHKVGNIELIHAVVLIPQIAHPTNSELKNIILLASMRFADCLIKLTSSERPRRKTTGLPLTS